MRILSHDIKNFPFPKTVISEKERINYINERDFAKQFQGLVNFLEEEPVNKFFLCRVFGVSIEDSASYNYNRTEFLGQNDSKIKLLKEKLSKTDKTINESFFSGSDFLFAIIPMKVFRDEIVVQNILSELQDSVQFLEIALNKFLFIDHESYVITTDFVNGAFKVNGGKGIINISSKDKEKN